MAHLRTRGQGIEHGVEVDDVRARSTVAVRLRDHITVRVEAAAIAHVAVVIVNGHRVVELGPADSLDVNAELLTLGNR